MASAIVSGIVLLLIASVVVEGYIHASELAQWERISRVASRDIGSSILAEQRALLILANVERFEAATTPSLSPELSARVNQFDFGPLRGDLSARVVSLAARMDWIDLAHQALAEVKFAQRGALGRWAPALVQTEALAALLDEMADSISGIDALLDPMWHARSHKVALDENAAKEFASDWRIRFAKSVDLRERLVRIGRNQPDWTSPYRVHLEL